MPKKMCIDSTEPLTANQRLIWLGHQLNPAIYHNAFTFTIAAPIKLAAFQQAFQTLINSSDALRTVFKEKDGIPQQKIIAPFFYTVEYLDFSQTKNQLQTWADKRSLMPFDLEKCSFDSVLIKMSPDQFVWYLNTHQIISDGLSLSLILKQVSKFYALSLKDHVKLPQFQDYIDYDREYRNSSRYLKARDYWQKKLANPIEPLTFYGKKPVKRTTHVQRRTIQLGVERTQKVITLKNDASRFNLFLAILATYLHRISGNQRLSIGVPLHNRRSKAHKETIGSFMQVLPLHIEIEENDNFTSLTRKIAKITFESFRYSQYVIRNPSQQPVYEVMLNYHTESFPSFHETPVESNWIHTGHGNDSLDIQIRDYALSGNFTIDFDFHCDVFNEEQRPLAIQHFLNVFDACLEDSSQSIHRVNLLSVEEKQRLLVEFNQTQVAYPQNQCIHHLFEAQVERTPDAIAVVFEDQHLSYAALNQKANQLAHHLQTLGVKPEVLVGLCIERSCEMILWLLGILKAGGAYLPLDPAYPAARLAFMLEDAQVSVLLTQSSLKEGLPETTALVVCLDAEASALSQLSTENPSSGVRPENLAYVIYTSGSTGKPKGVMILHHSIADHCRVVQSYYQLVSSDRVLQFSSLNFDASLEQIFSTLITGARLILRGSQIWTIAEFSHQIVKNGITVVNIPPAYWQQWLNLPEFVLNNSLKLIIVGGDVMLPEWPPMNSIRLINAYGPTEATITTTTFEITSQFDGKTHPIPIGRPLANKTVYILDTYNNPVPIGVRGELHIGGASLARGYLNRPELTAEKFIKNPFSEGSRLYKTGDLARYLPDGNIEYLGRIDNQVKIRGFRIELGEIEAVLVQHPAVRENAVIVHEKRLVAFFVPHQGQLNNNELRGFLKDRLPDYMIPSAFVPMEELPLTPNGKIDRHALLNQGYQLSENPFVAPRTPEEELLAGIWSSVLGVEKVGIHDNFFELGGHSLLATQIVSRLRDSFSVELPLRHLFESPTIAGLSEQLKVIHRDQALPPITPLKRDQPRPLSFAQQRLWFLDQLEGENVIYNLSTALCLEGPLHRAALEQSLQEIVQRHESLRSCFNGTPLAQFSSNTYKLSEIDLQKLPQKERLKKVQQLANQEAQRPFDLSKGPLFRTSLLQLGPESHILVLTMHHIISDGWSKGIFNRELSTLYTAFSQGQPSPLAPLPIQYADFAHWQRQWLTGKILEKQLDYWKQQLAGAPALLELPTDHPRPAIQRYQGQTESLQFSPDLTSQLKTLSQQFGTSLFMTLLSAFATLLSRYSGQNDIVIGTPIANRTHHQIEPLIGFFVNTLVLRLDLSGHPRFDELLKRVRRVALEAYAHQDLPFEQLVEELKPERTLSHTPLFQVMFVLQNAPMEHLELPGLTLTALELESVIAKFDLTLSLEETADRLEGTLEYNTDLFERATIKRMMGHFQTLLEGISSQQATQALLTEAEYEQLRAWNDTATDYPQDQCIHQLFEEQVERSPDAIAVVFEDQHLSYAALNQKANQLAHHLQTLGVKPEVLVALCVERSIDMVIGLLGILKAGGAYLPLEPTYPVARLAFMLENAKVLITTDNLVERLPAHQKAIVCLDATFGSDDNPKSGVKPTNLAYVMYTSGSTGQPKGVNIIHRGVVRLVKETNYVNLTADEVFLQLAPLSFDASTFEIWGSLLNGAKLILMPPHTPSLKDLGRVIGQHQVTTLWLTAGLFHLMVEERLEDLRSVRQLLAGGDVLSVPHVRKVLGGLKDCQLINGYGPTENTTFTCCCSITESQIGTSVPIGRPIANTQVYILDALLQPVPVGVPGELYIGGAGLARGYLNSHDLTAEKFIPNPFSDDPDVRLYKTGDLARYLPDGNIEFMGRFDNQVKIRGFRIELGEIEAVLAQLPAVQENVVIVHEDSSQDKRLVAYLVLGKSEPAIETIRSFLKERLPDYMIPNAFVPIEAMPLTPNGKIDSSALPAPDTVRLPRDGAFVPPRTLIEERLACIWVEILGIESFQLGPSQINIHDNFFELGGHSLAAARLISRVREVFLVQLPIRRLFEFPTIAELAKCIETERILSPQESKQWSYIVPIRPSGTKKPFFIVPGGGGGEVELIHLTKLVYLLGQEQPVYGLQARGWDGKQSPHSDVEAMATDYLNEVRTVQPEGPYLLGGECIGGLVAFEMAQQLQAQGQKVGLLVLIDTVLLKGMSYVTYPVYKTLELHHWKARLKHHWKTVPQLAPKKLLPYLFDKAKKAIGRVFTRNDIPQVQQIQQERMDAHINTLRRYRPKVYPDTLVLLVTEGLSKQMQDPTLGWENLAVRGLEIYKLPGEHASYLGEQVQNTAQRLRACLEQCH
ncbi:MAG: amino acid adenylation domain-containing protein [Pseudomonadota bacterium]